MHLDCCFSIISDTCCIMLEEMMGMDSPTRRLVDEYTKEPSGKYKLTRCRHCMFVSRSFAPFPHFPLALPVYLAPPLPLEPPNSSSPSFPAALRLFSPASLKSLCSSWPLLFSCPLFQRQELEMSVFLGAPKDFLQRPVLPHRLSSYLITAWSGLGLVPPVCGS